MRFDVVTMFPELVVGAVRHGVVGRGIRVGRLEVHAHDLRDHAHDRHRQVDDLPFGGGAGMVLKPEPVVEAVEALRPANPGPVVLTEPWGQPLDQEMARQLANEPGLVIVCGRYEGVDDRVRLVLGAREVSIGPYILTGGDLAALVIVDVVARLLPGVVGATESLAQDSFAEEPGAAGYPQYTRPAEFRGLRVPEVLLSGDHAKIRDWRRAHSRGQAAQETSP
jgi:tRNA (guanine37-N1)-methyltransferase